MVMIVAANEPGWAASLVVAASLIFGGSALVWLGRRQSRGTLKRNDLAGYRTKTTMTSDATWRAAHDASALQTTWAGIAMLTGGFVLLLNPPAPLWATTVTATTTIAVALVVWGAVAAQRAADRVLDAEGRGRNDTSRPAGT